MLFIRESPTLAPDALVLRDADRFLFVHHLLVNPVAVHRRHRWPLAPLSRFCVSLGGTSRKSHSETHSETLVVAQRRFASARYCKSSNKRILPNKPLVVRESRSSRLLEDFSALPKGTFRMTECDETVTANYLNCSFVQLPKANAFISSSLTIRRTSSKEAD